MSASVFHRDSCRLCEGKSLDLVLPLPATPIADDFVPGSRLHETQESFPLDLYLCRDCGHAQLLDVVNPDLLFRSYLYTTSTSPGLVEHFQNYADELLRRVETPAGSLVIDVGSNEGALLRAFKARGRKVLGIDPAREIAAAATRSGVETIPDYFTCELGKKVRREYGPAAVVTSNNAFAHSDHLADMADGVRELLAPDGVFVFEVTYLVNTVQKMLFDTIFHEHLCYHSAKPLNLFFKRHGLQLIDLERIPTKGGSIRGTVQPAGGPRPVSPRVGQLIELESVLGLETVEAWQAYQRRIAAVKDQLLGLVGDIRARGKSIAGYGASPTVTTLLYHFDLNDKVDFIVDDNPTKQNTFSPGKHIPVVAPQALYQREVDYVLVLAWNYAQPIMAKHQAFAKNGGRFIVPLPYLQVA